MTYESFLPLFTIFLRTGHFNDPCERISFLRFDSRRNVPTVMCSFQGLGERIALTRRSGEKTFPHTRASLETSPLPSWRPFPPLPPPRDLSDPILLVSPDCAAAALDHFSSKKALLTGRGIVNAAYLLKFVQFHLLSRILLSFHILGTS